jgi:hypothetical protein
MGSAFVSPGTPSHMESRTHDRSALSTATRSRQRISWSPLALRLRRWGTTVDWRTRRDARALDDTRGYRTSCEGRGSDLHRRPARTVRRDLVRRRRLNIAPLEGKPSAVVHVPVGGARRGRRREGDAHEVPGTECEALPGATSPTYKLDEEELGYTVRAAVTAQRAGNRNVVLDSRWNFKIDY